MLALGLVLAACPVEQAIYTLRDAPGVTAGFARQRYQINYASGLFFWVKTPENGGRTWWFSMNAPNGYGGVFLTPDVDATRITEADRDAESPPPPEDPIEVDFDTFDKDYGTLPGPPQVGDAPPAHLFARGLGPLLWYNAVGAANGDKTAKGASIPIGMYDLAGCGGSSSSPPDSAPPLRRP